MLYFPNEHVKVSNILKNNNFKPSGEQKIVKIAFYSEQSDFIAIDYNNRCIILCLHDRKRLELESNILKMLKPKNVIEISLHTYKNLGSGNTERITSLNCDNLAELNSEIFSGLECDFVVRDESRIEVDFGLVRIKNELKGSFLIFQRRNKKLFYDLFFPVFERLVGLDCYGKIEENIINWIETYNNM